MQVVREVGDTANGARVDLTVRGLRDPRINDHLLGSLGLLSHFLLSLLGLLLGLLSGELGPLLSGLLLIGLLRLGSRLLLLRLGSRNRSDSRYALLVGLRRRSRNRLNVLSLELRVEFGASRLADLGERHGVLLVEGLACGLKEVGTVLLDRCSDHLTADLEGLPTVLVGVGKGVIHVGSRLEQLRRDDALGHAALLLFGLLLGGRLHYDLGLLLGLGGRRRDDREKLLNGKLLEGLLDVLDAGHGLVCVRFLVA